jgi:hypothetical protein
MLRSRTNPVLRALALSAALFLAAPVMADGGRTVTWKVIGIVDGPASPFTTAAYFPRPLVAGELVAMTFVVKPSVTGLISGTYASYEGAIASAKVAGSDWSIPMRARLGRGVVVIANDDPDYGDLLGLVATTPVVPGKTWYDVEVDMRNPGGPNPGAGPWAPFNNLTLPKSPPALGYFPNTVFYVIARRDQAGQPADGGAYYGHILSFAASRGDD